MVSRALLNEPTLSDFETGSKQWFERQLELIHSRQLVRRTYDLWYKKMLSDVATVPPGAQGSVLELGSGSGYAKTINRNVITSDVEPGASDLVVDARSLPFGDESLRGIMLTHVFHHIPDVSAFLREAMRTLVPGGVIAMVDVAHTPFARFVFSKFHPEDYDSRAQSWLLRPDRPLGGANQALSWIVFNRDRARLRDEFPELNIELVEYLPWLAYVCSGGVTKRQMLPEFLSAAIMRADDLVRPLNSLFALHWHIRIRKRQRVVS